MSFLKKLFGNKNNEVYSTTYGRNASMTTFKLDNKKQSIPDDVFNLLWFADTKNKNYIQPDNSFSVGPVSISMTSNMDFEPSALISTLPIKEGKAEKLGYYPSYSGMSPEQRFNYLSWLKNVDEAPDDVGYAFTFYYGLERWLFTEKYEEAVQMIVRLKRMIDNNSFQDYSNSGLVFATIQHHYPHALKYINFNKLKPEVYLLVKYMFEMKIDTEDLIQISKGVGFTNHGYIKKQPVLFKKTLSDHLIQKFNEPYYKVEVPKQYNFELMRLVPLANYSLDMEVRNIEIGNVLSYEPLKEDIFNILQNTHEDVKEQLKEIRNNTKKLEESTFK